MAIKILMPSLSPTMITGNLVRWLKKEGETIKSGAVIAEIETDKATMEVESIEDGVMGKIIVPEGSQNVPVGSLIGLILEPGETLESLSIESDTPVIKGQNTVIDTPSTINNSIDQEKADRVFASPLAKRLAASNGLDISKIDGSGPYGRIIKMDIESALSKKSKSFERNQDEYIIKKHTNIRKIIASKLTESKQEIPHYYLTIECNVSQLLLLRASLNEHMTLQSKISVNDFIIKAASQALYEVKDVNSSWSEEGVILYNNIDISVAVSSEHGLITPIIKNADHKSVINISSEMKELVDKAKKNKLKPEEFQGGGFTISNLGMYGIKHFTAIINPPQSAILAIGAAVKKPIVLGDKISISDIMDVTLSCDHRVIDGALSAEFLQSFKKYIENPILLFAN
jgi:pyruvate dehydrogenase E2 component (dihydrolipoamide acetyltransferase)